MNEVINKYQIFPNQPRGTRDSWVVVDTSQDKRKGYFDSKGTADAFVAGLDFLNYLGHSKITVTGD